jgi:hypothetical protein
MFFRCGGYTAEHWLIHAISGKIHFFSSVFVKLPFIFWRAGIRKDAFFVLYSHAVISIVKVRRWYGLQLILRQGSFNFYEGTETDSGSFCASLFRIDDYTGTDIVDHISDLWIISWCVTLSLQEKTRNHIKAEKGFFQDLVLRYIGPSGRARCFTRIQTSSTSYTDTTLSLAYLFTQLPR